MTEVPPLLSRAFDSKTFVDSSICLRKEKACALPAVLAIFIQYYRSRAVGVSAQTAHVQVTTGMEMYITCAFSSTQAPWRTPN
jgi:hypothetical protein